MTIVTWTEIPEYIIDYEIQVNKITTTAGAKNSESLYWNMVMKKQCIIDIDKKKEFYKARSKHLLFLNKTYGSFITIQMNLL